jgi:hypothetical protein
MNRTGQPGPILQAALAVDPRRDPRLSRLPGVQPLDPADWIRVDDAYAAQMAERERLLTTCPDAVMACLPDGVDAVDELLDTLLDDLSGRSGFEVRGGAVVCPDGREAQVDRTGPLRTIGRLVQEDFCLLKKPDGAGEHVLVAAVLCFPASWTLAEKIGRPLLRIHRPVESYDDGIAARVQRLFDGVQIGRPLWRANAIGYADPALHQPRREDAPRTAPGGPAPYVRSEIQTIRRLPRTGAVVFGIHTYVVRAAEAADHPAGAG